MPKVLCEERFIHGDFGAGRGLGSAGRSHLAKSTCWETGLPFFSPSKGGEKEGVTQTWFFSGVPRNLAWSP